MTFNEKNTPVIGLGMKLWHVSAYPNGNAVYHPCRTADEWKQFHDQIKAHAEAVANDPSCHMDMW